MSKNNGVVHKCGCGRCREGGANSTRELHAELNAFLSSLDEEKRVQFLGLESMNATYGGDQQLELITGVKATVIAKMRWGMHQKRLANPYVGQTSYYDKQPLMTTTRYQVKAKQTRNGAG